MTAAQLSITIESSAAVALLLWMLAVCVPSYRLDSFRQRMFVVRDELFDYARAGNIGFSDPAYRLLRKSMNGFIRYGHRLSFFQLCVTFFAWHYRDEQPVTSWHKQWEGALSTVSDEKVKQDLKRFHEESMSIVIGRVVTGSPVLLIVSVFIVLAVLLGEGWKSTTELRRIAAEKTFKIFSIDTDKLEDEALRCAA